MFLDYAPMASHTTFENNYASLLSFNQLMRRKNSTTLRPHGNLNDNTYRKLIDQGKKAISDGTSTLVLDMSGVQDITVSGLFALYHLSLALLGKQPPSGEDWHEVLTELSRNLVKEEWRSPLVLENLAPQLEGKLTAWGFLK